MADEHKLLFHPMSPIDIDSDKEVLSSLYREHGKIVMYGLRLTANNPDDRLALVKLNRLLSETSWEIVILRAQREARRGNPQG